MENYFAEKIYIMFEPLYILGSICYTGNSNLLMFTFHVRLRKTKRFRKSGILLINTLFSVNYKI